MDKKYLENNSPVLLLSFGCGLIIGLFYAGVSYGDNTFQLEVSDVVTIIFTAVLINYTINQTKIIQKQYRIEYESNLPRLVFTQNQENPLYFQVTNIGGLSAHEVRYTAIGIPSGERVDDDFYHQLIRSGVPFPIILPEKLKDDLFITFMGSYQEKEGGEPIPLLGQAFPLARAQQREMIMKLYPPLIEDLRTSIKQCVDRFTSNYGFINRNFLKLREYFTDGTIKAIEGYDSDLYLELVKIKEETLPLLESIEESRWGSLELIRKNWKKILEKKETDINIDNFVSSFSASIIWEIWRGDFDKVKKAYDETISNLRAQVSFMTPPPESTLQELIDSAKKEMDKVKSMFLQVEQKFQEIEETVITRMDETIKNQF